MEHVNQQTIWLAIATGVMIGALLLVGLIVIDRATAPRRAGSVPPPLWDDARIVFLFTQHGIVQMTQAASDLVERMQTGAPDSASLQTDWERVRDLLLPRFPDLLCCPDTLPAGHHSVLNAQNPQDCAQLILEAWDGFVRLTVITAGRIPFVQDEDAWLKLAVTGAPYPIWQSDRTGRVVWANEAYHELVARFAPARAVAEENHGAASHTMLPNLFDIPLPTVEDSRTCRVPLTPAGASTPYWFDVHVLRLDYGWMNYATDVNAVVNAEIAQRNFVQTLTKTFAHLSIGLAIFDRKRQLALFNPALIDLTSLPPEFLSTRPNLLSFFDRLRDRNMMPEPKNYRSWRDQISDLVAAADHGQYRETWSLASGLTYRVSGRPHPDGAVAFLFEDISAEVSSTRRFRSQLELGQSVLNTLEQSIAVFSASGLLAYSNTAYQQMWGVDPDSRFIDVTVNDASRHWQAGSLPSPVWGDLRDFIVQFGERSDWQAEIKLKDGRPVICRVTPMAGGTTLVVFDLVDQVPLVAAESNIRSIR